MVERVREATDIVALIGSQVALKKMGARLGGLCPFHQEKTPSFYVNPSLQAYHCFGCGVGGDVFSFVMQYEKMTFPEALRHLADQAGIALPDRRGPAVDQLERIREALRLARSFYRTTLEGKSAEGEAGRAYLDGRGILPATREVYGLGLAPTAWDGLLRHARALGLLSERTLIEAGLALESSGGRVYDRFRHRLMVPLESAGGSPVGFGGRTLADVEPGRPGPGPSETGPSDTGGSEVRRSEADRPEPKYVNSPETPVYRKGSMLYGVAPAREGIRSAGRVLVVEGYFDVIALMQGKVPGVVGTCGTALTPEQAKLLKRLSDRVVLLFDGDSAGLRAALRALPILVEEIPEIAVAFPPPGKDPDLWIRQDGPGAVQAALERARGPLSFLEERITAGTLSRTEAARGAADLMSRIADPLVRDMWVQEAAGRFGLSPEAFREALKARLTRRNAGQGRSLPGGSDPGAGRTATGAGADLRPGTNPGGDPGSRGSAAQGGAGPRPGGKAAWPLLARECLRTALHRPADAAGLAQVAGQVPSLGEGLVQSLRWLARQHEEREDASPAALLSLAVRESAAGQDWTALGLAEAAPPEPVEVLLLLIQQEGLKGREEGLSRELRSAQEQGNQEELLRLLVERQQMARERADLTAALARLRSGIRPGQDGL